MFVASAMAHAKANAALQRLDKALHQSILKSESPFHIDQFQHELVGAVEVYAAAQQAFPFSSADCIGLVAGSNTYSTTRGQKQRLDVLRKPSY